MFKNVAGQKLLVFAFSRVTAEPMLGDAANITCKVALDNGAAIDLVDVNPVETEDGRYLFDLTQAETNGNTIDFYPESSTADVQVIAINHDRQSVLWTGAPTPGPTPDPGGLASSYAEYYGGGIVVNLPSTGDPQGVALGYELFATIAAEIAAASNVKVAIQRCESNQVPDVVLTTAEGLVSVAGKSSVTATDGSVTWAADKITVRVSAAAVAHLRPGRYVMALSEETTSGWRLLQHTRELWLYRTAGGLRV